MPVASGQGHDAAIRIRQHDAVLWAGRLTPGEKVTVPDAKWVHLFVARGKVTPRRRRRLGRGRRRAPHRSGRADPHRGRADGSTGPRCSCGRWAELEEWPSSSRSSGSSSSRSRWRCRCGRCSMRHGGRSGRSPSPAAVASSWVAACGIGILFNWIGLTVSAWYLVKVRPGVAAAETGQVSGGDLG